MARLAKLNYGGRLRRQSDRPLSSLEDGLCGRADEKPASALLCCSLTRVNQAQLLNSIETLREVRYLSELVLAFDELEEACLPSLLQLLSTLPFSYRIIRCHSRRLAEVDRYLARRGIYTPKRGAQRAAWYGLGYLLAANRSEALGLYFGANGGGHRHLLARLLSPLLSESGGVDFCIGDYSPSPDGTLSQAQDLLVLPLIKALIQVCGPSPVLRYLDSLHRPMPAAVSFHRDMIPRLRLPDSSAIELGFLAELKRNGSGRGFHQVDADPQCRPERTQDEPDYLLRRSSGLVQTLFEYMLGDGIVLDTPTLQTVKLSFEKLGLEQVEERRERRLASHMQFNLHQEEHLVEEFARCVYQAGEAVSRQGEGVRYLPSWSRVLAAAPESLFKLFEAVESTQPTNFPVHQGDKTSRGYRASV